ncbi:hypothetical protein LINGRAHAP2_LOCUS14472 [Linum grandiflorum]
MAAITLLSNAASSAYQHAILVM